MGAKELFLSVTEKSSVFVGEDHGSTGAIFLISDSLADLRQRGVNYIFLEQFMQSDQDVIDRFLQDHDRAAVMANLDKQGWAKGENREVALTYMSALVDLIGNAHKNGIKVMGIDDDAFASLVKGLKLTRFGPTIFSG